MIDWCLVGVYSGLEHPDIVPTRYPAGNQLPPPDATFSYSWNVTVSIAHLEPVAAGLNVGAPLV